MVNIIALTSGTVVKLIGGATAEIVENMGDGQWASIRYLTAQREDLIGVEELCHAQDIVSVVEA